MPVVGVMSCCLGPDPSLASVLTRNTFIGPPEVVPPAAETVLVVVGVTPVPPAPLALTDTIGDRPGVGLVVAIETVGLVYSWIGCLKPCRLEAACGFRRKLVGTSEILLGVVVVVVVVVPPSVLPASVVMLTVDEPDDTALTTLATEDRLMLPPPA